MQGRSGEAWLGKLPLDRLRDLVIGRARELRTASTLVASTIGEDAAVIDLGFQELVVHSDPITEAGELAGWLAVHVASNDVAVTGARPRWILLTILAPGGSPMDSVARLMEDALRAAREVGAEIVGGHTEATPGLGRSIVVATAMGVTCRGCSVPSGGSRPGDLVLQAKPAGIEGAAILATDFGEKLRGLGVSVESIKAARELAGMVSVVEPAVELAEAGLATSMHDPTEGGLLGGLVEMAEASGHSIEVDRSRVIVAEPLKEFSEKAGIDPLKLISSGTLLATVPRERAQEAADLLKSLGVEHSIIGRVVPREEAGAPLTLIEGASRTAVTEPPMDEIARIWSRWAPH